MRLFFDTSSFIKRYIDEAGSGQIEQLCAGADDIAVSILLPVEAIATTARLKREQSITTEEYDQIKTALFSDLRDVTIIVPSPAAVQHSIAAIEGNPLKALDALHIGCAVEYKPDFFISSDRQQLAAAVKAGLKIKRIPY